MKMKRYHILWLPACLLLLLSCENEIELNFENRAPKLIMNALISNDNEQNYLSLNMTGPYATTNVEDATVEIQVNGSPAETPERVVFTGEGEHPLLFSIRSRFRPGDVVRFDARTPDGKHHAWAEVTVPQPATIVKVDTMSSRRLVTTMYNNSELMDVMRYKITIKDRPQEKNYYRLIVESYDTTTVYIPDSLKTKIITTLNRGINQDEDVVLTDGQPMTSDDNLFIQPRNVYSVFDDHRFRDQDYTLTVYSPTIKPGRYYWYDYSWGGYPVDYVRVRSKGRIYLLSITEAEYRYLKILNVLDSDAYDEILNEPISFPSNVNGGTGHVSISSSTSFDVCWSAGMKTSLATKQVKAESE